MRVFGAGADEILKGLLYGEARHVVGPFHEHHTDIVTLFGDSQLAVEAIDVVLRQLKSTVRSFAREISSSTHFSTPTPHARVALAG